MSVPNLGQFTNSIEVGRGYVHHTHGTGTGLELHSRLEFYLLSFKFNLEIDILFNSCTSCESYFLGNHSATRDPDSPTRVAD